MEILHQYKNGSAEVTLHDDGTRIIQFEDELKLDYPLNVDIRVSNRCPFGLNPKTGKSSCEFCHESATTNGEECNYEELKHTVDELPKGTEFAIGCNEFTDDLHDFLVWCSDNGYVCNLTINQMSFAQKSLADDVLLPLLNDGIIHGLGVSYRKDRPMYVPDSIIEHDNTVLHVIAGIDDVDDVISTPFKKVLVLGYKKFGFGVNYHSPEVDKNIKEWFWFVRKLIDAKEVVSFDNLALEQLTIRRFFSKEKWDEFNQGEHSMYINAVSKYFAPSSRSSQTISWNNLLITEYFKYIENEKQIS